MQLFRCVAGIDHLMAVVDHLALYVLPRWPLMFLRVRLPVFFGVVLVALGFLPVPAGRPRRGLAVGADV